MRIETFFDRFDLLAETSNSVAKMRELVLQLAAQGRLCPQLEADGNAETLLQEVAASNGSEWIPGAYEAVDPPLTELPTNWRWAPASMLLDLQTGKRMKGGARDSGVISLGGEHLSPDGSVDYTVPRYISEEFFAGMKNGRVELHDTLMVKDGATTGKTAFVEDLPECGRAAVNEHVFILRWHPPVNKRCAFYFIRALALTHIATQSAGVIGGIRRDAILDFPIPVPPLAEQERIVAKVDELMSLCDRLEAQQQDREHVHAALTQATLARFGDEPKAENLEYLFHESYSTPPGELRKAILTLAVRGQLCQQSEIDGPIDELLATNDDRRRRTAANDARADAEQQELLSAEDRWNIPVTWEWRGLADLVLFVDYRGRTPKKVDGGVRLVTAKNVRRGEVALHPEEFITEAEYDEWMTRGFPVSGDVLFTTEAPMGFAAVVRLVERFALAQRVICFQSYGAVDGDFLVLQILSDQFQHMLDKNGTGVTAKGIKAAKLKRLPIAVPPLAEQRRIVAKVNDLMALVDRLEADLAAARVTGEKLMDAVVAELTTEN